jgi:hypothetical protein
MLNEGLRDYGDRKLQEMNSDPEQLGKRKVASGNLPILRSGDDGFNLKVVIAAHHGDHSRSAGVAAGLSFGMLCHHAAKLSGSACTLHLNVFSHRSCCETRKR